MSLRAEILSKTLRGNKIRTPEQIVDEIFEKIEKRIDERIEQIYDNAKEQDIDWTIRDKIIREFIEFKEMLK